MPNDPRPLLTESELAERWSRSARTLRNDRSARRGVPYVKLGGSVRYRLADVEAYEARGMVAPAGGAE